jgi:YebC/PmpR family DNA-binding regulatory protein
VRAGAPHDDKNGAAPPADAAFPCAPPLPPPRGMIKFGSAHRAPQLAQSPGASRLCGQWDRSDIEARLRKRPTSQRQLHYACARLARAMEKGMAGHSKWANIKHKKAAADAKRGKVWTRLIKEIQVAARMGGGDIDSNPRLRLAVEKAYDANMPKDNVNRAIQRGVGGVDGASYEEIRYEGYGIGGAAVIVDTMTDNRIRTVAEVRHAFSKNGGNMGTDGSVAFMFDHVGQFLFAPGTAEDKLMEAALEAGADDVVSNESGHEVYAAQDQYAAVAKALEAKFGEPRKAALVWRPQNTVAVGDEQGEKLLKLIENLNEHDDVQNVYANFEVSDALVQRMSA